MPREDGPLITGAERLETAFATRAEGVGGGRPLVGVFGDGLPEALVAAAGGLAVDVKAPPLVGEWPRSALVDGVVEPFMDDYASRFLHRFAAGRFDGMAALIFCRDDVAGLAAYQYANEMRRQGLVGGGPPLHLWNLLHTDSEPAHRFNRVQAEELVRFLAETLGRAPAEGLAEAMEREEGRRAAVERMEAAGVGAADALAWRNAGRWLDAATHAALLDEAVASAARAEGGPRLGLVGTATESPGLHRMLGELGAVVDLQPYGRPWPGCHSGGPDLGGLLRSVARYPLHVRAAPPERFGAALLEALEGCDVVVSQVDTNDDSFGWEVPRLGKALAERGVPLVDLGFRPFRPDPHWLAEAKAQIAAACGEAVA